MFFGIPQTLDDWRKPTHINRGGSGGPKVGKSGYTKNLVVFLEETGITLW